MIAFDLKNPQSLNLFGKYEFQDKKVSIVYEKYTLSLLEGKKQVSFCCFLDSKDLAASSLTKKNLALIDIKHSESYPKALGVNCYSFASGRSPLVDGDDPVPGGYFLQKLRTDLCKELDILDKPKTTKAKLLQEKGVSFEQLLSKIENPLTQFSQVIFGKKVDSLNEEEQKLLLTFLTNGYQILEGSEYISCEVIDRLLQLDGLIKVYPNGSEKGLSECEFGRVFLAAFVNPKVDYHFMRYFKDGWYERVDDKIRKRLNMKAEIPFPENDDQMREAFNSKANEDDLKDFQFVGYYLVPTTATLADKIGRKYILEHHKV